MSRTELSYQVIHCITKIAVDLSAYIQGGQSVHWVCRRGRSVIRIPTVVWSFRERTTLSRVGEHHVLLYPLELQGRNRTDSHRRGQKHFIFSLSHIPKIVWGFKERTPLRAQTRTAQTAEQAFLNQEPHLDCIVVMCAAFHTTRNRAVIHVTPLQETRFQPKKAALVLGCDLMLPSQVMTSTPVQEDHFEIKKTVLVTGTGPLVLVHK